MVFEENSVIGILHIMSRYRTDNVVLINAPGNDIVDDKRIYYFVSKIIKYYLDEESTLNNILTYLPLYEEDRKYVLENYDRLIIKDVAEAGGYGAVFGNKLDPEQRKAFIDLIQREPKRSSTSETWTSLRASGGCSARWTSAHSSSPPMISWCGGAI